MITTSHGDLTLVEFLRRWIKYLWGLLGRRRNGPRPAPKVTDYTPQLIDKLVLSEEQQRDMIKEINRSLAATELAFLFGPPAESKKNTGDEARRQIESGEARFSF